MLPAAIIEIMLPVVVAEDELVDRLRAIVEGAHQRLADRVLERPLGPVADRDADAAGLVVRLDVVGTEEEIIFAVLLDRRRRPHRIGGPSDILDVRSEEHTSELQSLMRISYAVFCLKKKKETKKTNNIKNK